MEFKFRAIDNINNPSTTPTVTYLPANRSLQMDGGFSGFGVPLSANEAALQREIEKEQIRREILRRRELEEEVRRELAMEGAFGIGPMQQQRPPLNFQEQRASLWSNSTPILNPVAVDDHIGASQQPPLIMAPPEIKHSSQSQISDNKDKVILLAKPDPGLYSAKRKAVTHDVPDAEPYANDLKKKSKEEWSCELCQIKATSESGLNAHLNGKKHKAREAGQKRKIDRRNRKGKNTVENATKTFVNTTKSRVDAETDQQPPQPCIAMAMNETVVDKGLKESIKEEQLVETVADNGVKKSNNEKLAEMIVDNGVTKFENEKLLVETVADNGVKKSNNEKLAEMIVDNGVTKFENEKLLVEMVADNGVKKSNNEKLAEMMVDNGVTKFENEKPLVEMVADNGVKKSNYEKLSEMMVDNDVTKFENEEPLVKTVADNGVAKSNNEKLAKMMVDNSVTKFENEEPLVETVADNGVKKSNNEKLAEMMVDNGVTNFENEEPLVETLADNGVKKSNNEKLAKMMVDNSESEEPFVKTVADNGVTKANNEKLADLMVDNGVTKFKNEEQLVEMVTDNGVSIIKSKNEKKIVEMKVDKNVTESKFEEQLVEKSQNVGFSKCRKDAATDEAGKESALTTRRKVGRLWCELCQIGTFSQVVMDGHIKGKKHIKNMKKLHQKNANGVNKETNEVMTLVGKGEPILKKEKNL